MPVSRSQREDFIVDERVTRYYSLLNELSGCADGRDILRLPWDRNNICWDDNPFCWDDVALALEISGKVIATDEGWLGAYEQLDEPKKKRFIYLVAKVKGEHDIYKGKKEVKNVKLNVKDIKLTVEKILNIAIDVEVKQKEHDGI